MFPRYEIGDIIRESTKLESYDGQRDFHYLILDKKFAATQNNMADLYLALCLDNNKVGDRIFQDTVYHAFKKVA